MENYTKLINNYRTKAVYVFCDETYNKENDINAGMFAPEFGSAADVLKHMY